jgi:hypothetical protein
MSAAAVRGVVASPRVVVRYTCPPSGFGAFEDRLRATVADHEDVVELCPVGRCVQVIGPTLPAVVILRDGVAIAEAIGDLPAFELRCMVRRVVATLNATVAPPAAGSPRRLR